ncbi:MAG TPA: mycofactocin system transcriptional regulator [Solirubrobacterales bacterium]|nr:mycofactocin system transcriptional regulator [Solirubrobacterales bacterium]
MAGTEIRPEDFLGDAVPSAASAGGRPPSTTHDRIIAAALELFSRQGFSRTTVDEIAAAAGVGRRTIFRYFGSKNDIVMGDFDANLARLRRALAESDPALSLMEALRRAVLLANQRRPEQLPALRMQTTLITRDPVLQAHAMMRYAAWRRVVADFAAERSQCRPDELMPQAIAYAALGTSMAAFTRWVRAPGEELERCLDDAFRELASGFATVPGNRPEE